MWSFLVLVPLKRGQLGQSGSCLGAEAWLSERSAASWLRPDTHYNHLTGQGFHPALTLQRRFLANLLTSDFDFRFLYSSSV